jgi:hypothetical protein
MGKSADRQPGRVLAPYFSMVLDKAAERRVPVEQHFEKLEYFNSSTLTAIIQLIQEARAREVKLVIRFDQGQKWQKLNFDALRVFMKGDDLLQLQPV